MAINLSEVPNKLKVECFICEKEEILTKNENSAVYMHQLHKGSRDFVCNGCYED